MVTTSLLFCHAAARLPQVVAKRERRQWLSSRTPQQLAHLLECVLQHAAASDNKDRILCSEATTGGAAANITTYRQAVSRAFQLSSFIMNNQCDSSENKTATHRAAQPHRHHYKLVALSCAPGADFISSLWGTWGAGRGCVPLSLSQSVPELEYVLQDTQPEIILVGGGQQRSQQLDQEDPLQSAPPQNEPPNLPSLMQAATNLGISYRIVRLSDVLHRNPSDDVLDLWPKQLEIFPHHNCNENNEAALILYTSGTTGKPKGVVLTHGNVRHQVQDLVKAWKWQSNDVALHVLPLHHVHGLINIVCCATYVGARIDFRHPFDAQDVWRYWASDTTDETTTTTAAATTTTTATNNPLNNAIIQNKQTTVFMAVPTIYAKLLEATDHLPPDLIQRAVHSTLRPMRLFVSGSAALPVPLLERWKDLTGHTLLERYGMTEFGMALSNPYDQDQRRPGHVGLPLPSVQVRLVAMEDEHDDISGMDRDLSNNNSSTTDSTPTPVINAGLLQIKGPTVFREYLNRPEATRDAFDEEGYFHTGDVAAYNEDFHSYRILGRASADILKVGGYKLSALEIEQVLLEHPDLAEVVILGVPDESWGERVAMMCRMKPHKSQQPGPPTRLTLDVIREWCQPKLAKYKIPSRLLIVDEIPKNAMGKVNKRQLVSLFKSSRPLS